MARLRKTRLDLSCDATHDVVRRRRVGEIEVHQRFRVGEKLARLYILREEGLEIGRLRYVGAINDIVADFSGFTFCNPSLKRRRATKYPATA